jgi:hypothetical protein
VRRTRSRRTIGSAACRARPSGWPAAPRGLRHGDDQPVAQEADRRFDHSRASRGREGRQASREVRDARRPSRAGGRRNRFPAVRAAGSAAPESDHRIQAVRARSVLEFPPRYRGPHEAAWDGVASWHSAFPSSPRPPRRPPEATKPARTKGFPPHPPIGAFLADLKSDEQVDTGANVSYRIKDGRRGQPDRQRPSRGRDVGAAMAAWAARGVGLQETCCRRP